MAGNTCIQLRIRRTIHEDAYINVPVTAELLKPEPNPDGTRGLDFNALVRAAVRLGANPAVEWKVEDSAMDVHPVQGPRPEGRSVFDVHDEEH
jgi:hypothetical protein